MMFSRFILLLLFSSATWGAGLSICVDLELSIDPILYLDPSAGLSSYSKETVFGDCSDTEILSIAEQEDQSLSIIYKESYLKEKSIRFEGVSTERIFSEVNFEFHRVYLVGGTPHLIDAASDSIWQWDDVLGYWKDLGALMSLPQGDISEVAVVYRDTLYFSVIGGEDNGFWKLGVIPEKISNLNLTEASLTFTHLGLMQFYQESETTYEIKWLNGSYPATSLVVEDGQLESFKVNSNTSGSLFSYIVDSRVHLFWLDSDNNTFPIELPENWQYFGGCFNSQSNILCAFDVAGQGVSLYELVNGNFELDSILSGENFDLSLGSIKGVYAAGINRFISFERGEISYLYSVNDSGEYLLDSGRIENINYHLYLSGDSSQFYWLEISSNNVVVNQALISGDATYQRLYVEPEESEPMDENEVESPKSLEEADSNLDEDSAGSGSMPTYLLAMLFMLLLPRVRWRQVLVA